MEPTTPPNSPCPRNTPTTPFSCCPAPTTAPTVAPDALAGHTVPVTILQGDEDNYPVAKAEELADALPDAEVHVVEGTDHSFVGGRPEDVTIGVTVDVLTR